jgi:predicted glycoside hydrolase/deacetylase ChbG (UPF0249 family)
MKGFARSTRVGRLKMLATGFLKCPAWNFIREPLTTDPQGATCNRPTGSHLQQTHREPLTTDPQGATYCGPTGSHLQQTHRETLSNRPTGSHLQQTHREPLTTDPQGATYNRPNTDWAASRNVTSGTNC